MMYQLEQLICSELLFLIMHFLSEVCFQLQQLQQQLQQQQHSNSVAGKKYRFIKNKLITTN